jgi:hypothetical protein
MSQDTAEEVPTTGILPPQHWAEQVRIVIRREKLC